MDERHFIAELLAPLADESGGVRAFGFSDDAALITPPAGARLVFTKDVLTEGVHFPRGCNPGDAVRKAVRTNLSDLAAKGACPYFIMTAFFLPETYGRDALISIAEALREEKALYGFRLAGGDTVRTEGGFSVSVTAAGLAPESGMITRAGASPGDVIYAAGAIGDAYIGLSLALYGGQSPYFPHFSAADRAYFLRKYMLPEPLCGFAPCVARYATACADVSDGLLLDLSRIAGASRVSVIYETDAAPFSPAASRLLASGAAEAAQLCAGGDDYALICAVPPQREAAFVEEARARHILCTRIGAAVERQESPLIFAGNVAEAFSAAFSAGGGYSHG